MLTSGAVHQIFLKHTDGTIHTSTSYRRLVTHKPAHILLLAVRELKAYSRDRLPKGEGKDRPNGGSVKHQTSRAPRPTSCVRTFSRLERANTVSQ
ncbi:uncharacterized protein [Rhodnius prolixus]|uniref:uncharacterized protein n=1 Tax=Rhodnius prolixus TaxID=13249 RepID=UPI003D18E2D6